MPKSQHRNPGMVFKHAERYQGSQIMALAKVNGHDAGVYGPSRSTHKSATIEALGSHAAMFNPTCLFADSRDHGVDWLLLWLNAIATSRLAQVELRINIHGDQHDNGSPTRRPHNHRRSWERSPPMQSLQKRSTQGCGRSIDQAEQRPCLCCDLVPVARKQSTISIMTAAMLWQCESYKSHKAGRLACEAVYAMHLTSW